MKRPKRRNALARLLASPLFRQRVIKAKKGKGAYRRKGRNCAASVEPEKAVVDDTPPEAADATASK